MKTYVIILLSLLLTCNACENFLDVRPEGQVVNNALFSNAEGFEDALYGVYGSMAGASLYGRKLTFYLNDVLAQYYTRSFNQDTTYYICSYQYDHQLVRPLTDAVWTDLYKVIGYINNILINLYKYDEGAFPYYRVYEAECLGLRAFLHFELLRFFSENYAGNPDARGIPYNTNYSYEIPEFLPAGEVYEKIIRDLQRADSLLTENGEYFGTTETNINGFVQDRNMHMNLYAVQATLARVYWTMGKMKEAADWARKVIGAPVFELADKMEIKDLVNGILSPKETIFGLYSANFRNYVRSGLYQHDKGLMLKDEHDDDYSVDKVGVDYRYEGWFRYCSTNDAMGLRCIKLYNADGLKRDDAVEGLSLIRLPEMYYIVAEYYLSENQPDKAVPFVDKVIASRGLTPFADRDGVTLTLGHLIRERKKEFIGEGQYFHTLKRYNQDVYESRTGNTFKASNAIYVFPIPETETEYR